MTTATPDIHHTIVPADRDLGDGFHVKRVLPAREQMMVGPFIFFDQMGPAHFQAGDGLDVRPHPHIGLATVTYLFEGEILHRDSLGVVQPIKPGEVNWMIAGRGIVHSERTSPQVRASGGLLSGIQLWVALPKHDEEIEPQFAHVDAAALPTIRETGVHATVIAGETMGLRSPVPVCSPMFYVDAKLSPNARMTLKPEYEQRAFYVADGVVELRGHTVEAGRMLILQPDREVTFSARRSARVMLLGGERMSEPRYIWWNLVSSSEERIRQAADDWRKGRFPAVPHETEFIPAPDMNHVRMRGGY